MKTIFKHLLLISNCILLNSCISYKYLVTEVIILDSKLSLYKFKPLDDKTKTYLNYNDSTIYYFIYKKNKFEINDTINCNKWKIKK